MNKKGTLLSIVLPIYNEEGNIAEIINRIDKILVENNIKYEIILIDDGSSDNSWANIELFTKSKTNIRGYRFSRNFGKEAAIFAGLEVAKGDAAVVMDSDLQHPPEVIIEMYERWINKKPDIVSGVKVSRGSESKIYKICSKCFYSILYKLSGLDLRNGSDFKLLDRKVIDIINSMPEKETFFRAMCMWVGFKNEEVEFKVSDRLTGNRKWTKIKLIKYAVNGITQYTSYPLYWITYIGIISIIVTIILGINTIYNKICGNALAGFTTVILITLFIGGILMISLGIIGQYLALIYNEIKGRPKYIISERCEVDKTKEVNDEIHKERIQIYK